MNWCARKGCSPDACLAYFVPLPPHPTGQAINRTCRWRAGQRRSRNRQQRPPHLAHWRVTPRHLMPPPTLQAPNATAKITTREKKNSTCLSEGTLPRRLDDLQLVEPDLPGPHIHPRRAARRVGLAAGARGASGRHLCAARQGQFAGCGSATGSGLHFGACHRVDRGVQSYMVQWRERHVHM